MPVYLVTCSITAIKYENSVVQTQQWRIQGVGHGAMPLPPPIVIGRFLMYAF